MKTSVEVDSAAGRITVDLRDNVDCIPCGFNLSEACARTAAMIGIFNGLGVNAPSNGGSFRRTNILLRENCVVGIPRHPTSCSVATTNVADRVTSAVQAAIADLGEGFGMAEAGAIQTPACPVISGYDQRHDGQPFVNQVALGDTCGPASAQEDGWLTMNNIGSAGMMYWDSVEVDEMHHPIVIWTRRLVADTEGPGRFRGAPASQVELGPRGCSMRVIYISDGTVHAAQGVRGGHPGAPAQQFIRQQSGQLIAAPVLGDLELAEGESIVGISCGGGGYGSPLERDPERVRKDVKEGYVTPERARRVYGVEFEPNNGVDSEATEKLRARLDESGSCPVRGHERRLK